MKHTLTLCAAERSELELHLASERRPKIIKRLNCIRLLDLGWPVGKISDAIGIDTDSVCNWRKLYQSGGWDELMCLKYKKRVPLLEPLKELIFDFVTSSNDFVPAHEVQDFLRGMDVDLGLTAIRNFLKKS